MTTTKEKFEALSAPQKQSLIGKAFAVLNYGAKESASDLLVSKIYKCLEKELPNADRSTIEQTAREHVYYQVRVPSPGSDEDNRIEFMLTRTGADDLLLFWMFENNPIWQNVRRDSK